MIGTRLGPYEIVEEIGKGGMATVYRAYQPNVGRFVAVKVIHRFIAGDKIALERFQREAKLVARLENPHLLPVYDFDGTHDPPYIVMRYLEGGTLKEILDQTTLPLGEISYLMRQVSSALDYAHRQGVIHRDIKPSNIMIDQDGNAFVADFGIARIAGGGGEGLTQTGYAVGTPGYMAPEQGMALETIDHRADIYSLGVMLFQMVTGKMPYTSETPLGVIMKHINDPVPVASETKPGLPPKLDEVVAKAMAKRPDDRYQTVSELADELYRSVASISGSLRPTTLRRAAQGQVDAIHKDRETRKEEIDATMATFEAQRAAQAERRAKPAATGAARTGATDDGDTVLTPTTGQKAATPRSMATEAMRPQRRLGLIGGVIAAVVVIVAIGLLISSRNNSPGQPTATLSGAALNASGTPDTATPPTEATTESPIIVVYSATPPTSTPRPGETVTPLPPSSTPPPSWTPPLGPSLTPSKTDTPTQTPTEEPSNTGTPATPVVQAIRNLFLRVGPSSQYPVVATLQANQRLNIIGISEDGAWFQVELPDGTRAWVPTTPLNVQSFGDTNNVPAVPPPTDTPTNTPTDTATSTPTPTATDTPTNTPTDTATFTYTPSDTPTSTATPTSTPTASATPTYTPTATYTPSDTPTSTPTPTGTPTSSATPTYTPTSTPSATPTPTSTASPIATATPIPQGQLPYVADFEGQSPLDGWDYDANAWQVVNDGGQNVLVGQAVLNQPIIMLGRQSPQWLNADAADLVINFSVNLDPNAAGARLVFRYTPLGYEALEILPGLMVLRRNAPTVDVFNRADERVIRTQNAPIVGNHWYHITLWVEGSRLYVYLDNQLEMTAEDLATPALGAGQIMLQLNSAYRAVRFDDFVIQKSEPASDHFQGAALPSTWQASDGSKVTLQQESGGNQYVLMQNAVTLTPLMDPISDLNLTCRIMNEQGGYKLYLRNSSQGAVLLDNVGGNLTVSALDGGGNTLNSYPVPNFYNRNRWEDVSIAFIGDKLQIYRDGTLRLEQIIPSPPVAGGVAFETRSGDILAIDDCLFTRSAATTNASAAFALTLEQQVNARPIRTLLSDLDENFDDIFRTDDWWQGGRNAAGDFTTDTSSPDHQQFLRMTYTGAPTWRLFRDVIGVSMFGRGADRQNFSDSTDLLVTVDVRFPQGASGTAWLGTRSTPSITGQNLNGYRLELRRNPDSSTDVVVRYDSATNQTVIYEGAMRDFAPGSPDWVELKVITYHDKLAFFVNGRFIATVENAEALGGTLALGVEDGTTADFDTLNIRDTTPHGQ